MAWQEARDGGADDGVRAKDHLLSSVKSRRSKRVQVESFPAWAVFRTTIKARAWQFAAKRHQLSALTTDSLQTREFAREMNASRRRGGTHDRNTNCAGLPGQSRVLRSRLGSGPAH